jgi:threonine dehydrogenase-like Zn-dependent dehydrogenase
MSLRKLMKATMGHELIGVVEETGAAVTSVRKGDFVIATFAFQDNTCVFCREGFQTACVHGGRYGTPENGGQPTLPTTGSEILRTAP